MKADHVRAAIAAHDAVTYCDARHGAMLCGLPAGHEGRHQPAHDCHWPGCDKRVAPAAWGCKRHWFALPAHLRSRIWRTYKPGQEISKTPSADYIGAAQAVQDWIRSNPNAR